MPEQKKIDAVPLTHHHFDHTRDLVTLAANAGHICPRLLKEELIQFRRLKGYLPRVVVVYVGNPYEQEIRKEVAQVAQELEADISLGCEDMKTTLQSLLAALPPYSSGRASR